MDATPAALDEFIFVSNPILQRELVSTLRASRSAWTLSTVAALLATLTLLLWPAGGIYSLGEQAAHTLLSTIAVGGLLLALLIAPAFTATCLTSEKENASYDLLTHTLLRPGQIARGKILSSQCFLLLLVLSTLPALGATLFLGGTGPGQILNILGVIAAATVATGLIGFAMSAWHRESFSALVITYILMFAWMILPLLPIILLPKMVTQIPILGTIAWASPLAVMLGLVEPGLFARFALPISSQKMLVVYFSTCATLIVLGQILGTIRMLFPTSTHRSRSATLKKRGFPYMLLDPDRRKSLIGNWTNVILAKELRSKTFGRATWMIRSMYATFSLSILLVILILRGGDTLHLDVLKLVMIGFQVLVVTLIAPALLASAFTQEVEQRQFDLLRQTPISPHAFLFGKAVSAWLLVILLLISAAPMWWMMNHLENYQWQSTLVGISVVSATLLLASSITLNTTLLARTTAASSAMAYALISLLIFGTLLPLLMGAGLSAQWRTAILSWNPFAAGLQAMSSEFLKGDPVLWKPFLSRTLIASILLFAVAWGLMWNKLRRES